MQNCQILNVSDKAGDKHNTVKYVKMEPACKGKVHWSWWKEFNAM